MSVHWEIGNAFSAMFKRRSSTIEQAQKAIKAYREIPIKFVGVPLEQEQGQALEISPCSKYVCLRFIIFDSMCSIDKYAIAYVG